MSAFDGATQADRLRAHFEGADHLYATLLAGMADDWEDGGVTRELLAGWEDEDARHFPQLRLLAGLFRIVLRGDAPQLAGFYPVLGGDLDPGQAWPPVREVFRARFDELRASLDQAPQTNEPARSVALLVGVAESVRRTGLRRVRLLEPGASAGLGLLVDRYRFVGDGWAAGPADSSLVVPGCGAAGFRPEAFDVVERRGCDVSPVDATSEEGAAYLTSFVWPWQADRHQRLAAALSVARRHPVVVESERASSWVADRLAEPVADDVLTVVWHSVTRLYWPPEETDAVRETVEAARARMPLSHVAMEHPWDALSGAADPGLPVLEVDDVAIATCDHHGPPIRLR
ncbi:MAG: DUF2332 domain-containing protein [Ornithinibacter sp.]